MGLNLGGGPFHALTRSPSSSSPSGGIRFSLSLLNAGSRSEIPAGTGAKKNVTCCDARDRGRVWRVARAPVAHSSVLSPLLVRHPPPRCCCFSPSRRVHAPPKYSRTLLLLSFDETSTMINGHSGPSNGVAAASGTAADGYTNHTGPSTSAGGPMANGYAQ